MTLIIHSDELRLAWRRNEGGIREKVNRSYKDKNEAKQKIYYESTSKSVSSDSESSESASDDVQMQKVPGRK